MAIEMMAKKRRQTMEMNRGREKEMKNRHVAKLEVDERERSVVY
jgi:hypothetical protein